MNADKHRYKLVICPRKTQRTRKALNRSAICLVCVLCVFRGSLFFMAIRGTSLLRLQERLHKNICVYLRSSVDLMGYPLWPA